MNQSLSDKNSFFSAFTINVIFIVFIIIGLALVKYIPVKLNPGKSLPVIYIDYNYYGATPEIVEKQVTSKLESVFETIKGIENIKSYSGEGWGQIQLNINEELNAQMVRFEVLSLVREIYPQLPNEVSYPRVTQAGADKEKQIQLMTYTINGNANSYILYKYLDNQVQPRLSRIKGIQKISVHGSTPYEWEIEYFANRLKELEITNADIKKALRNYYIQSDIGQGRYKKQGLKDTIILMTKIIGDEKIGAKLSDIPIKKSGGRIIKLDDVAKIAHKQKQQQSFYRMNGLTAVNMVVYAASDANQLDLTNRIKDEMLRIKKELPPGYSITLAYDSSVFLKKEIQKTFWRTIASITVLLIFVLLVSRNIRYLAIIVISLFANLSIAIFFYYILKIEIHLYSLAGITVSLGILIDNSIIMTDHLRHKNNKKVFLAVLAATLTTIGALVVIFFLEKEQQINLIDFAWVIIVNLLVSLVIALFFIPSVMEKIPIKKQKSKYFFKRKRRVLRFNIAYKRTILWMVNYRIVFILLGLFSFGLPVFMLPGEIKGDKWYINIYNKTLAGERYTEKIKPWFDKITGGTLRLFSEHVHEDNYFSSPERTTLNVIVKLPQGASINHLNEIYLDFENYISKFEEIDFFQTNINGFENSRLVIYFKKKFENGTFPYLLKGKLESKAIGISSADFSIYGVGRGFNNALYMGFKNSRLVFSGYNYNELIELARQAGNELVKNPRINEVFIESGRSWWFRDVIKSYINIDKRALANAEVPMNYLVNELEVFDGRSEYLIDMPFNGEFEEVRLISDRARVSDLWSIMQTPLRAKKSLKLKNISTLYTEKAGKSIYRENQEYIITLAYDFIGPDELSRIILKEYEEEINKTLPIGYKAFIPGYGAWWNAKQKKQYYLLFLMILIVYFICVILLESLIQPLLIIAMIPLSMIGIFLTFYVFGFKFDQGGYASFLLVSGLVVNSALYILNDFNNYDSRKQNLKRINKYVKAYSYKILPVLLTIISTILGLIPFIFWGNKEPFWFALAVGTIGGLLFSIPAIILFLPLMLKDIKIKKAKLDVI